MDEIRINNHSNFVTGFSAVVKPTCNTNNISMLYNSNGTAKEVTLPYNTQIGYLASTTGNISGIYDMSGGSNEYMFSVVLDTNGLPFSSSNLNYNSGFNGMLTTGDIINNGIDFPNQKYFDSYDYHTSGSDFYKRILGEATGKLGSFLKIPYNSSISVVSSWYKNDANFSYSRNVWNIRGALFNSGTNGGIFAFSTTSGHNVTSSFFRIVLSI